MAEINKVIAAILRDVTEARASADLVSRDLARQYAADDIMKYFTVPKVQVAHLQFEIKYAVESVQEVPLQSSVAQNKLAQLIKGFTGNLARSLQSSVSNNASTNKLYQSLGSGYPGNEWRLNVEEIIEEELKTVAGAVADNINGAVESAEKNIKTKLINLIPIAKRVESLDVIPNSEGQYEILSFDAKDKVDLKVGEGYEILDEAINDAGLVVDAIQKKTAKIETIIRNDVKKTDEAQITIGTRKINIITSRFSNASIPDKLLFNQLLIGKEKFKPVAKAPWLLGKTPTLASSTTTPRLLNNPLITQAEDSTLITKSTSLVSDLFRNFKADLEKLKSTTSESKINVQVDTHKLKDVDPSKVLTLQFQLDMKDFSLTDEDEFSLIN